MTLCGFNAILTLIIIFQLVCCNLHKSLCQNLMDKLLQELCNHPKLNLHQYDNLNYTQNLLCYLILNLKYVDLIDKYTDETEMKVFEEVSEILNTDINLIQKYYSFQTQ